MAGGLPVEVFDALEQMVVAPTFPDLTFILDVPAEVGLARARATRRLAQALSGDDAGSPSRSAISSSTSSCATGYLAIAKRRAASLRRDRRRAGRRTRSSPRSGARCERAPAGEAALMARAPAVQEIEALPEADRLEGFPHPRETRALFGHEAAERELAQAFAGGRMHHAWLLAGPRGHRQGDVGLSVRACTCWRGPRSATRSGRAWRSRDDTHGGAAGARRCRIRACWCCAGPTTEGQALRGQHSRRRGAAAASRSWGDRAGDGGLARRHRRCRPTSSTSTPPTRC